MAAKVLSIEICDQIVKVCRTEKKGKVVRISDMFTFRTPESCVSDGIIASPQVLGLELMKQLATHGLHGVKPVVFSLTSSKIAVREVKLPPMKKKLLAKAVMTNAEEYFPVDLKNYHITYRLLDTNTGSEAFSRVLVMAAPISMLEGYFSLAEKAGLTIKAIDSSGNSQYQVLKRLNIKGVTLYADINSTSSMVSFIREYQLLLQRTFAFGAEELISHYMSVSGISDYDDAVNATDVTNSRFSADKSLSTAEIQDDLNRLVSGIVRSVDYFNSSQWEASTSRVVLMGANRHIVGLRELILEATGLETLYLDDIHEFTSFTDGAADASSFVSCIGSSFSPLDLIPPSLLPSGRHAVDDKDASIRPGVEIGLVFVLIGVIIAVLSITGYNGAVHDLKSANDEINNLTYTEQTSQTYISYQKGEDSINTIATDADTPNSKLTAFFEELEAKMPSSILLLSATCTNKDVSMNVTIANYTDAAAVIEELRGFESIAQVDVSDLTKAKNDLGAERVSFTVHCVYGQNPYLNGINPYQSVISPSPSATPASGSTGTAAGTSPSTSPAQKTGGTK